MRKIIKNTTLSDITLPDGRIVGSGGQVTIDPSSYRLFADSVEDSGPIVQQINDGDVVINDGVRDLSVSDGISYLKYPDRAFNVRFETESQRSNGFPTDVHNVQDAIEYSRTTSAGKLLDFEFNSVGNTANKWVNVGHPSISSDDVPFVVGWSGKIIGLSFANKNDNSSTDLKIYVNGVLGYTWEIRNKRTAWKVSGSGFLNISQGDRVSVYMGRVTGTTPRNIFGEVIIQVLTFPDGAGGTQYGV